MATMLLAVLIQQAPHAREIDAAIARLAHEDPAERERAEALIVALARDLAHAARALEDQIFASDPEAVSRAQRVRLGIAKALRTVQLPPAADEPSEEPVRPYAVVGCALPPERLADKMRECAEMLGALDREHRADSDRAELVYQKFLRYYEVLRGMCAGDGVKVNMLDAYKLRAEQIHGGAERQLRRAAEALESGEDAAKVLDQLGQIRRRREFFQDGHAARLDMLIREAERRKAEASK